MMRCASFLLVALFLAKPARANEPVRFEYDAPAECPSEAEFLDRVRARAANVRLADEGAPARRFLVTIKTDPDGATARVDFVHPTEGEVSRSIRGETCDEAVTGIALVCALALDGQLAERPNDSPADLPPTAAPSQPSADSAAAQDERRQQQALEARTPRRRAPIVKTRKPAPTPSEERVGVARAAPPFAAGIGAGFTTYPGPEGAPVFDAFFDARPFDGGPSLRASAWHFRSEAATRDGKEALFRGYGLRLEGCPLRLDVPPFFVSPCLGTDVGMVTASAAASRGLTNARDKIRGWWSAVLIARLGLTVSRRVVLEAQGELVVPFILHRYGFGDPPANQELFEMSRFGASARGGVGVLFP
jgi:hypothetical protein